MKLVERLPLDSCGPCGEDSRVGGILRQLTLFGTEPRPLPREACGTAQDSVAPDGLTGYAEPDPGQIDLFAERARLGRDLEEALRGGDCHEARRLRRLLEEAYGVSAETRALSFLEELAEALASPDPEETLTAWGGVDSILEPHPWLRRLVRDGLLGRLLRSHSADDLTAVSPGSLSALASVLASAPGASTEDGKREARRLVRDALLAGRSLESVDFAWDEALMELLAEDEPPPWLACLGVIRRLWPAPRPSSGTFDSPSSPIVDHGSTTRAALAFWSCLRAAEDRDCTEGLLHEARRRMKALRPDLHTLYMRRSRSRD
jgi:hypothetical protein